MFLPWRDTVFNLIEIGVGGGSSMHTWSRFFSQATIIGVDIIEQACRITGDCVVIEIGSQVEGEFIDGLCDKYPPSHHR